MYRPCQGPPHCQRLHNGSSVSVSSAVAVAVAVDVAVAVAVAASAAWSALKLWTKQAHERVCCNRIESASTATDLQRITTKSLRRTMREWREAQTLEQTWLRTMMMTMTTMMRLMMLMLMTVMVLLMMMVIAWT